MVETGKEASQVGRPLSLFIVAGEHSGDALGGPLMAALARAADTPIRYAGVGGEAMAQEGLETLFPLSDVAVMGPVAIAKALPRIVRRVYTAVDAGVAAKPDAIVIIDAPEFTHPIAKRLHRRLPGVPIIDYVSPSVWAWRPGRAKRMRAYIDHVMALLPFEPEAHARLGGPPCSYVGHPLIERRDWIESRDAGALAARLGIASDAPVLVVLPGSRSSEVSRLMVPFGETMRRLKETIPALEVIIPVASGVRDLVTAHLTGWPLMPKLVQGEDDKFAAFRLARAALAASGTVTLELALAGTPMVVAYKVDDMAAKLRFLVKVPSIVLANLVLGENAFPEFIQEACQPDLIAPVLAPLLADTPARAAQRTALARIAARMQLPSGTPSEAAAAIVIEAVRKSREGAA
jgi:lipid-A-disaccharide synthase